MLTKAKKLIFLPKKKVFDFRFWKNQFLDHQIFKEIDFLQFRETNFSNNCQFIKKKKHKFSWFFHNLHAFYFYYFLRNNFIIFMHK